MRKRSSICIVLVIIVLISATFTGCKEQPKVVTQNDIVETLKTTYLNIHVDKEPQLKKVDAIYLGNKNNTYLVCYTTEYKGVFCIDICNFTDSEQLSDLINRVLTLYGEKYKEQGTYAVDALYDTLFSATGAVSDSYFDEHNHYTAYAKGYDADTEQSFISINLFFQ